MEPPRVSDSRAKRDEKCQQCHGQSNERSKIWISTHETKPLDSLSPNGRTVVFFQETTYKNYPGKRPQTVGGTKGDETSGGDDDDDDIQMRAQRSRHMRAHESRKIKKHIWKHT